MSAFVVWPIVISATIICMAWLRDVLRQRRRQVTPRVGGLVDAFLPATLLGPALAGLGAVAMSIHMQRGGGVLGPIFAGVWLSVFFFWPLRIVAFLLGVVHRIYVSAWPSADDGSRSRGQVGRMLARMTAINMVSVARELVWLTRPMNLSF